MIVLSIEAFIVMAETRRSQGCDWACSLVEAVILLPVPLSETDLKKMSWASSAAVPL